MTIQQDLEIVFKAVGAIVAVGGGIAAVAYGLFRFLGQRWLEQHFSKQLEHLKHEHEKEIEQFRYRANSLFSRISKVHEKEFEVLPRAWELLHVAYGAAFDVVSALKETPDLHRVTEAALEELLAMCPLSESARQQVRDAQDKTASYRDAMRSVELSRARVARTELNNYLVVNSIFMTQDLRQRFRAIDEAIAKALIAEEVGRQARSGDLRKEAAETIGQLSKKFSDVESEVQKRLHYEEA